MTSIDPDHFRKVMGQFPTGVVVVTAMGADGEALGMTVGSFTSVSLDPPLVAYLPAKTSSSYASLQASGDRFCVNVLDADQEEVCRLIATRKQDKFEDIGWTLSPGGCPVIDGAVAYVDCEVEAVHDAGDHDIVIGRVTDLELAGGTNPLLFFRGGYGAFRATSLVVGAQGLADQLRVVDLVRPDLERMAAELGTEVTAMARVGDELVLVASCGHSPYAILPSWVGHRVPFIPPFGSIFAAYGGADLREAWYTRTPGSFDRRETLEQGLDGIVERGFGIALGHEAGAKLERLTARFNVGDPQVSRAMVEAALADAVDNFNPQHIPESGEIEVRSLSTPLFVDDEIALTLMLWGPPGPVPVERAREMADRLRRVTDDATRSVAQIRGSSSLM